MALGIITPQPSGKPKMTAEERYLFRYRRRGLRRMGVHLGQRANARTALVFVLSGRARAVGKAPWETLGR